MDILGTLQTLWLDSGFAGFFADGGWKNLIMIGVACVLLYLGIVKKFEPLLLLPIAFGMFLINLPGAYNILWGTYPSATEVTATNTLTEYIVADQFSNLRLNENVWQYLGNDGVWYALSSADLNTLGLADVLSFDDGVLIYKSLKYVNGQWIYLSTAGTQEVLNASAWAALDMPATLSFDGGKIFYTIAHTYENVQNRGLLWYLFYGVQNVIYPPLIFLGIGAMTDFGPLISNPKSMLIGAAAQLGIFLTLIGAVVLGFDLAASASIAIIGGADGPTAIYLTQTLAKYTSEDLLSAIAIAAYSYMALIPIIQKPLMRLFVPKKERLIKMKPLRKVSKLEKVIFPIVVTLVVGCLLPDAIPLLGMLMLGNLLKECGVCDRLSSQAQNGLMNTVTIFLGVSVGCKAYGGTFLQLSTLGIIGLGLVAFACGTIGGLLMGRLMCKLSGGKINPLIGSAGVSAVPMAARISEDVGREEDPSNHLLMHAMGPNVAGVIGSAIAAGFLLAII